jgi:hypothetical protein
MSNTQITSEPRVYAPESRHSWYGDVLTISLSRYGAMRELLSGAQQRLARYETELAKESETGTVEGRRADRILRASCRSANDQTHEKEARERVSELRALTTGGGATASASGGGAAALVAPAFLMNAWAPFRGIQRSFADQCYQLPLPAYGMEVYLPYFSSTTKAGKQTEGGTVTEAVPSTELEGAQVQPITGELIVTEQLRQRAFTGGGAVDLILHKQLNEQLEQEVDLYTLNQAISAGAAVSGNSSYTTEHLYEDTARGREKLTDTAGTRLRPTHFFSTSDLYSYATRQVDGSGRPILTPKFAPGFPLTIGADDFDAGRAPKWSRFTGTILPGGVLWFENDNIPPVGTTSKTQLLVSAPEAAIVLMEDEPVFTPFVETLASELKTVVNLREYACAITRHASGTAVITGNAYLTSLV